MSQVWQIRQSEQSAIAIVSGENFSCEIAVAEFSYSATELSFRFYPRRRDGFLIRGENVFLGRSLLEGISSYQVELTADSIVVARLTIRGQIQQLRAVESGDIGQRDRRFHTLEFRAGENCHASAEVLKPYHYPLKCCDCRNFHGKRYGANFLVCAMHPYGKKDCEDFEAKVL